MSETQRLINRVNKKLPQELAYHWSHYLESEGTRRLRNWNRALRVYEAYHQGVSGWEEMYHELPEYYQGFLKDAGVSL